MKKLLMVLVVVGLIGCGKAPENASVPVQLTQVQQCDLIRDKVGKAIVIIDVTTSLRYTFNLYDIEVRDSNGTHVVGTENLDMPACTVEAVAGKLSQVVYK